ncbi:MAG: hypothetical protein WBA11_08625 [Rubrivirga sp.]
MSSSPEDPLSRTTNPSSRADWPVRIYKMGEEPPAWEYWLSRPAGERSAAIESLRAQQHGWSNGALPRLQRVLRVVKGP